MSRRLEPKLCRCGCGELTTADNVRGYVAEWRPGHNGRKYPEFNPEPRLCACGCGEYTTIDKRRRRIGKYVTGHNGRVAHGMKGKTHTPEVRARLASYTGERASSYKHGWSSTPTWKSWRSMHERCYDPHNASYERYGAKGVVVAERWHDFLNFLADMGARPSKDYQIDRVDPEGNYEPSNCRWLTRAENLSRRRNGWAARRANKGD